MITSAQITGMQKNGQCASYGSERLAESRQTQSVQTSHHTYFSCTLSQLWHDWLHTRDTICTFRNIKRAIEYVSFYHNNSDGSQIQPKTKASFFKRSEYCKEPSSKFFKESNSKSMNWAMHWGRWKTHECSLICVGSSLPTSGTFSSERVETEHGGNLPCFPSLLIWRH